MQIKIEMLVSPVLQIAGFLVLLVLLPACDGDPESSEAEVPVSETAVEHAKKHLDSNFVCPMHPQIVRGVPGSCPICGMDLVEKRIATPSQTLPVVLLTPDVVQKLGVRTMQVKQGRLQKSVKTVGYVTYNEHRLSTVRTKTSGWVENLSVRREGLEVEKGQLLLELYSPEFLAVQKEFIAAQKKDKSGTLKKYGQRAESVGPRDYLRYLDISESLVNEIARSGKPRHRIPIYSPQHGTIVRHAVHKHLFVPAGFPMFTIADLSSVWVEADVYEHQLQWVERGLSADIKVQALPGQNWQAQVSYIYPELDPRTRTLKVRLLVPNPDETLKPNMFVQVIIHGSPTRNVLKIPRQALIVTGERESVILDLGNGRYQPADVTAGLYSQGEVEVLSGLKEGDRIVVSGQFLIDSEANLQASFQRFGSTERE